MEVDKMVSFIVGVLVGGFLGVLIMCMCNVASKADEDMEKMTRQLKNKESDEE
jgi:uncharacterized membrane-anchored protein YhcB (DUF1043 family)